MFFNKSFFNVLVLCAAVFLTKVDCSALRADKHNAAPNDLASSDDTEISIRDALRRLFEPPTQTTPLSSLTADDANMDHEGKQNQGERRFFTSLLSPMNIIPEYRPDPITSFIKRTFFLRMFVLTTARIVSLFRMVLPRPIEAIVEYLIRRLA